MQVLGRGTVGTLRFAQQTQQKRRLAQKTAAIQAAAAGQTAAAGQSHMVDRGNWVMFHKEGGYIQTMKPEEELKMRTLMNTMKGARVPIERKGQNFIVQIKVQQEGGFVAPEKVATKRWSTSNKMDVDEGKLQTKNRLGALAVAEEEKYGENAASVFAGREWGM